jgi:hypothetical protein
MSDLKHAVAAQMGYDEDDEEFRETMSDVARGGADAGWSGFTYTTDCVAFFREHEDAIMDLVAQDADDYGYKDVATFMATFNRADMLDSGPDGMANLLAWYALEHVAREVEEND